MKLFKDYLKSHYDDYKKDTLPENYYKLIDLIGEILQDKEFPESDEYDAIYYYLKKQIPDNIRITFSELFNDYLNFKEKG